MIFIWLNPWSNKIFFILIIFFQRIEIFLLFFHISNTWFCLSLGLLIMIYVCVSKVMCILKLRVLTFIRLSLFPSFCLSANIQYANMIYTLHKLHYASLMKMHYLDVERTLVVLFLFLLQLIIPFRIKVLEMPNWVCTDLVWLPLWCRAVIGSMQHSPYIDHCVRGLHCKSWLCRNK